VNFWKIILATLVIFVAGVLTGGLLVTYSDRVLRHAHRDGPRRFAATPPAPGTPRELRSPIPQNFLMRTNLLERLDHELKLGPAQREHIEKIIHEGQERIKELSQRIQPQVREELAQTRERINTELSPDQQVRFEGLIKHRPNPTRTATNAPPPLAATNALPAGRAN